MTFFEECFLISRMKPTDLGNETQAIAARFAHELSGPIGSAAQAFELSQEQLQAVLSAPQLRLWQAGLKANLSAEGPVLTDGTKLMQRLHRAIAQNPAVENLTGGLSAAQLEAALKLFELGRSHQYLSLGLEGSRTILKNLREWERLSETPRNVSLARTLKMAWAIVSLQAKNLSIRWNLKDFHRISGNPHALLQVWMNIFRNAAQANPKGCLVQVYLHQNKDLFHLTIANDGKTLPIGVNIFAKGRSTRKGGSGLGLSICKKILRQHGGTISARNIPADKGRGVEFLITLPTSKK